jgi:hypothetical protein
VILKSFLHALPAERLPVFGTELSRPRTAARPRPVRRATRATA